MTGSYTRRPPRDAGRTTPRPEEETRPIAGGPIGYDGPLATARSGPDPDLVHRDPRFRALRSRVRRFVFVGTTLFLGWYAVFVGLSAFAPSLVRTPVVGSVNLGLLLGLAQFVSTLVIVGVYGRFARREIDPRVRELKAVYSAEPPSSQTALIAPVNGRRTA